MAKFKFSLIAGFAIRGNIKSQLQEAKQTLEYKYPESSVSIREEKNWFETTFFIQGVNFPDTDEFSDYMKNWEKHLKSLEDDDSEDYSEEMIDFLKKYPPSSMIKNKKKSNENK